MTPTFLPRNSVVTVDLNGTSTCSATGSASISARNAIVGPGLPPFSTAVTPVMRDAGLHIETQLAKVIRDEPGGPYLAIAQLGMLMNVPPPGDHIVVYVPERAFDLLGRDRGECSHGADAERKRGKNTEHRESPCYSNMRASVRGGGTKDKAGIEE